jgi:hypothetical protein
MAHLPHPFLGEEFDLTSDCENYATSCGGTSATASLGFDVANFRAFPGEKLPVAIPDCSSRVRDFGGIFQPAKREFKWR